MVAGVLHELGEAAVMRGWRLRRDAPAARDRWIGTVAASAVAATMAVAATSIAGAHTTAPAGRLAGASVVVAARTTLHVTVAGGDQESIPLPAYRGVPARLAPELARVPGVARAAGETGFPGGVVRPGDVDLVAVTARPGVSAGQLAHRIRAVLPGDGYTVATGARRGRWRAGRRRDRRARTTTPGIPTTSCSRPSTLATR